MQREYIQSSSATTFIHPLLLAFSLGWFLDNLVIAIDDFASQRRDQEYRYDRGDILRYRVAALVKIG